MCSNVKNTFVALLTFFFLSPRQKKSSSFCSEVSFLSTCSQELRGIKDDDLPSHTLKLTVVFKHKCDAKQGIFDSSTATPFIQR